jgi:hypothetical protein
MGQVVYTRIGYKRSQKDGLIVSAQQFKSDRGAFYEVELDIAKMTYKIRNMSRNKRVITRSTEKDGVRVPTNLRVLKSQARRALEGLGVRFKLEMRTLNI